MILGKDLAHKPKSIADTDFASPLAQHYSQHSKLFMPSGHMRKCILVYQRWGPHFHVSHAHLDRICRIPVCQVIVQYVLSSQSPEGMNWFPQCPAIHIRTYTRAPSPLFPTYNNVVFNATCLQSACPGHTQSQLCPSIKLNSHTIPKGFLALYEDLFVGA